MSLPADLLREKLKDFLEEDVGLGDITTELVVPSGINVRAQIIVKEPAVIAGLHEMKILFEMVNAKVNFLVNEGEEVPSNTVIAIIEGDGKALLSVERTVLNLFSRMSGIATETRKLIRKVREAGFDVRIAATRKTAPGLRYFDKRAVIIGGGDPHRLKLDDQILIKDNHIIIAGGLDKALSRARSLASFTKKIEVEVKTVDQAVQAVKLGADIIMLDNMSVSEVHKVIESLKNLGLRDRVLVEVSGGINEENILEYASLGPDVISIGALTHSVKSIDASLDVIAVIN